jgi:tetratricopeptide (TPR) repeat protein
MDQKSDIFERIRGALAAGDLDVAASLADKAVSTAPGHSVLIRLVAETLERSGRIREAAMLLARAVERMPGDPMLLIGLGGRLLQLGRSDEAMHMFEAAASADPRSAEAWFAMGKTKANDSDFDAARAHFEKALEIAPGYAEARATLANLLARAGDAEGGRAQAERALKDAPNNTLALTALAVIDVNERNFTQAEGRLRGLLREPQLDASERALATSLLGDALDGQDKTTAAYLTYASANEMHRKQCAPGYAEAARGYIDNLDRLAAAFDGADPAPWRSAPPVAPEDGGSVKAQVFLVGFPRSGTTLLEQVLAAHPDVVTLEEKPTLDAAEAEFLEDAAGLQRLKTVDAATAGKFRRAYWDAVRAAGVAPEGKVLIDKLPLNTPKLPLIVKLFPDAKILFARRDPRDVVLSCFRRTFLPNIATYSMLSLAGAAELYAAVMRLADVYREALPLDLIEVRYETFVENFEDEARAACAFLGLAWDDRVSDFAARRGERLVNTPSAAQVRRGIYRGGEGQWRRYRDQLAPVMPVLAPWIGPKGYPAE